MRLDGKRALITGGGTGIGRATAELFGREGARVTVSGRRRPELEETVQLVTKAGGPATWVQGDVSRPADAERMVLETVRAHGGLDILVNNAGVRRHSRDDFIERPVDSGPIRAGSWGLGRANRRAGCLG